MRITVYTGSSSGHDPLWTREARAVGQAIGTAGHHLVYGGGHVGLMGTVADAALDTGAPVTGVIPAALVETEQAHPRLTALEVVADVGERKRRLAQLADAMVALPGGAGTLEEFFESWTWQQLGVHAKPVALYSPRGFWDPLVGVLDHLVESGFLRQSFREGLIVASTPETLLRELGSWTPPPR
jgi:uncharacterized protein (TIGR00730 family)